MSQKTGSEIFRVKAATWGRGCWSAVLVLVPAATGRKHALEVVARLLNYRTQPTNGDSGRQYLVSASDRVHLVRATSSDQARTIVGNQSGDYTKRPVWVLTMRLASHPHRSAPFEAPSRPWKCYWCGCRDFTINPEDDQTCPSCGHRSDNASCRTQAVVQTGMDSERGWPPRELDPTLRGIDIFFDQQRCE